MPAGAAGAKPLNGDSLTAGHSCAAGSGGGGGAGDEDAVCNCANCKEKVRLPAGQEVRSTPRPGDGAARGRVQRGGEVG